jgi:hypothetical protein
VSWARPFAATNEPNTCKWCGWKLRRRKYQPEDEPAQFGDYGDGHFCGLRCAYQFATVLANGGRRLTRKGPPKP